VNKSKAFLTPLSISNLFNNSQVLHVKDHGSLNSLSIQFFFLSKITGIGFTPMARKGKAHGMTGQRNFSLLLLYDYYIRNEFRK
jgi:hypothetical protein